MSMSATASTGALARRPASRAVPQGAPIGPRWTNTLFVMPFLIVYLLLLVIPLFHGIWLSLNDVDLLSRSSEFVGLKNFRDLWADEHFHQVVRNTFASCS